MIAATLGEPWIAEGWAGWGWAFAAAAVWGLNLLILMYGVGPPLRLSRPPVVATAFALVMTVGGSGSYWATRQIYPWYHVGIERAACFVALCTASSLAAVVTVERVFGNPARPARSRLEWDWSRLAAVTYVMFAVAAVGTTVAVRRIGYIPILSGDPTSARVDFPAIGGIWYRLSMLGGVVALLVAAQAAARRANFGQYVAGLGGLGLVGLYGPRFFVVLPVAVALLLWDLVRAPIRIRRAAVLMLVGAPLLALVGYWREQDASASLLGPIGIAVYGTLGEFRDLGWALDYYGPGDRFLRGATLGSLIVPLLPSAVWNVVGIDKAAIYGQNSASLLADAMGQTTGQRIGAYGEFFINYGWVGAIVGAVAYGFLLAYLDRECRRTKAGDVRSIFLALAIATTIFAQIGQLNMFTSTLTGLGYPLVLVVLIAARRPSARPLG